MQDQKSDSFKVLQEWFQINRIERTRKALERNGFRTLFVTDAKSAIKAIMDMIPAGATVGIGGSVTLHQIGFFEEIKSHRRELINPFGKDITLEQRDQLSRKIFSCDYFVCGTNAVTEEGHLFNIDNTGNRVAAMVFGPKKTIIVCGVNKIAKDMEEARKRVWGKAAPMNAKRLGRKTPCADTGVCTDCNSSDRICNISVELLKKPARSDILVLLVGEPLGL